MKQKLIRSIYPLSDLKRGFLLCTALNAKPRIFTSSYRHGIKRLHELHEQSEAVGPACRDVFFFVFSSPLLAACAILDKKVTIWQKFQTY